jgi:hypothetical protein
MSVAVEPQRERETTYSVVTKAPSIIQLTHHAFQFLLQSASSRTLLLGRGGKSKDPFLQNSPHVGTRYTGLDGLQIIFLLVLVLIVDIYLVG